MVAEFSRGSYPAFFRTRYELDCIGDGWFIGSWITADYMKVGSWHFPETLQKYLITRLCSARLFRVIDHCEVQFLKTFLLYSRS
jgi:hypothetical protein